MNFDYSEEQILLQQEARKFLTGNSDCAAVRRVLDDTKKSFDDTQLSSVAELGQQDLASQLSQVELLKAAKTWQALKVDHGFACITWPTELSGPAGSTMESVIFTQEEEQFDIPLGIFQVRLGICMPTVIKLSREDVKQRFVKPALRGEEIWCQLFSEPAAGSDLAGIRTRAVRKRQ
jgi:alkylation response protein AidB-like acyl-CoA dehydrogenase